MSGLLTFSNLAEAVRAGFEVCGQTSAGYLVRARTRNGWALAIAFELARSPQL
jgi:hypothetical protein